jgi:hypothetical protein
MDGRELEWRQGDGVFTAPATKEEGSMRSKLGQTTALCLISVLAAGAAGAQTTTDVGGKPAAEAAPTPATWWDAVKFSGYLDAGITLNPRQGDDSNNFGQLFTDKANKPLLNQLGLTVEKALDPKAGFDWGFKFQGFYGSDARYTHFLGELDRVTHNTNQLDIVEANVTAHLPYLTEGGIDLKVGQYPTPLGYEVIDPKGNVLYSHSYIFQFGLPFKHTGGLATVHVSDLLDVYGGVDSGTNTSLGDGDPNSSPAFLGGFGLNFLEGKLSVLALTHVGPELPNNNHDNRYFNDILITNKLWDPLTLVTELNWVRDDSPVTSPVTVSTQNAFGLAQYAIYALSDTLSVIGRAEVFRDESGTFVSNFIGNQDFIKFESGNGALDTRDRFAGRPTTFGSLTLGLNWKPPVKGIGEGTVIRPEIRYDQALSSSKPFDTRVRGGTAVGTASSQLTFAADIVIPF